MRWRWVGEFSLVLVTGVSCVSAAVPQRVLIIDSFGRDIAPFNSAVSTFRTTIARELGKPVDIYEASLDAARFAEPERETPFVEFLKYRFEGRSLDLVVPVGAPAVRFTAKYRDSLFPRVPVVYTGVDPRMVPPGVLASNATLVTQKVNLPGIVENILELQPGTTNIAVIFGASPLEKFWTVECRREFSSFTNRVSFTWLNDLPLDVMTERVRQLPPNSFIMFGMLVTDAAGVPYDNDAALQRLHEVANVPLFGYFASQFGHGIIGGRLYQDAEVGRRAGFAAVRILNGESPQHIPPVILEPSSPTYDWRELNRWNIDLSRLSSDSEVRYRTPSLWELYRWRAVGMAVVCLIQFGLILFLIISRRRLRQAQADAQDLSGRLIGAQEKERGRLARELHDDVTQRLALLAIDAGRAANNRDGAGSVAMDVLKDGLVRLSEDVHSLAYRLHPSVLEDLGLAETLKAECERFSARHTVICELKVRELPGVIAPDTALCLFRVAQGALRNVARHAKAKSVEVLLRGLDDGIQLAVRDDGIGFDPERVRMAHSLGLASMRERVHLVKGELEIESGTGNGTTVLAWVPART